MICTEEQAKSRWCPFARVYVAGMDRAQDIGTHNVVAFQKTNDAVRNPQDAQCIASECMMWRRTVGDRGYCGLAGKP